MSSTGKERVAQPSSSGCHLQSAYLEKRSEGLQWRAPLLCLFCFVFVVYCSSGERGGGFVRRYQRWGLFQRPGKECRTAVPQLSTHTAEIFYSRRAAWYKMRQSVSSHTRYIIKRTRNAGGSSSQMGDEM